jgi:hypothetical protein
MLTSKLPMLFLINKKKIGSKKKVQQHQEQQSAAPRHAVVSISPAAALGPEVSSS